MPEQIEMRPMFRIDASGKIVPNTCTCGCAGSDSSHAAVLRRVVRDKMKCNEMVRAVGRSEPIRAYERGAVTVLGGDMQVAFDGTRWFRVVAA